MRRLFAALLLVISCCAPVVATVCTNTFTTRAGKGSTLTWSELDADITNSNLVCSWADAPDLATGPLTIQIANDTVTGTTNKLVAKLSAGKAIKAGTSDSKSYGLLGVVVAGGATSGSAKVAISGTVTCTFDGTATQGDYVALSTGTAGDCTDAGATLPTDGTLTFGIVAATHSGSGDTTLYPYSPDVLSIRYPVQGISSSTDHAAMRWSGTGGATPLNSDLIIDNLVSGFVAIHSTAGNGLIAQPVVATSGAGGFTSARGGGGGGSSAGGDVDITGGPGGGSGGNGGAANVLGGSGQSTNGSGGSVSIAAGGGAGSGSGGSVTISASGSAGSGTAGTASLKGGAGGASSGAGGEVDISGGTGSAGSALGGATVISGGVGGPTGQGGGASLSGGPGGVTSGAGGAVGINGGPAQNGNSAGGTASIQGGASAGTDAGGETDVFGGNGGGSSGAGGAVKVTGGTATGGNANGGDVTIKGGFKNGSGVSGAAVIGDSSLTNKITCDGTSCRQAGAGAFGRVEMPMAASVLSNVVGTAQAQDDCTLAATNLGTTLKQYGSLVLAKMDGYSNVALSCRVKEGSTQSGTITMQLQNLTDGTTTVAAFTTTTTTCATVTGTASSVALTGYKEFAVQIKSANSTDDPLWGSCTLVLEP